MTYEPGKKYGRLYNKVLMLVPRSGMRKSMGSRERERTGEQTERLKTRGNVLRTSLRGMYNMSIFV